MLLRSKRGMEDEAWRGKAEGGEIEVKRLKPEEIKPGRSYRLMPRYTPFRSVIRKVEEIRGDKVVVQVNGEMKEFPLEVFADLAVEEVE